MRVFPAGKYLIRRFVPTRKDSWRETKKGVIPPTIVEGHWVETTIQSTEPITITKL